MTLNLATYFVDARVREGRGDALAIRTAHRTWRYREISAMTGQVARLLAQADVRPEERVIIALPDGVPFVAALFGILRRGAAVVMVNPDSPADLLAYFFEYTRARAAFADRAHKAAIEAATSCARPDASRLRCGRPEPWSRSCWTRLVRPPHHSTRTVMTPRSGSSAAEQPDDPRPSCKPTDRIVNTTERYGQGVLGLTSNDVTMAVPKLFFGYAMGSNVLFPFSVGASCVLFPERSTPETVFAQIEHHRPTILINVPTMVQQMVAHPTAADRDLRCLRLATSAGEALPAELYERWQTTFGVELLDGLGTAEMWHIFLSNRPGAVVPGTLGHAVEGFRHQAVRRRRARGPARRGRHAVGQGRFARHRILATA